MDPVEMLWGDGALFDQISRAVNEALAKAWEEGYKAGFDEEYGALRYPLGETANPYRKEAR